MASKPRYSSIVLRLVSEEFGSRVLDVVNINLFVEKADCTQTTTTTLKGICIRRE
jgi:hypothetical protein